MCSAKSSVFPPPPPLPLPPSYPNALRLVLARFRASSHCSFSLFPRPPSFSISSQFPLCPFSLPFSCRASSFLLLYVRRLCFARRRFQLISLVLFPLPTCRLRCYAMRKFRFIPPQQQLSRRWEPRFTTFGHDVIGKFRSNCQRSAR